MWVSLTLLPNQLSERGQTKSFCSEKSLLLGDAGRSTSRLGRRRVSVSSFPSTFFDFDIIMLSHASNMSGFLRREA
ncbi:hypothetical protein M408DRAFT_110717 [Serendipita vermifera MAFF 305830]|uniref:Uncharacterized protein n=1 Tax=Serendipita vermifera MAFF 305830 TaxID=933852 RepID=A0A0C2W422_SERVB|nr:hypothetical protein M408DRAFT_110717 [Serendipita vermifera MAFF 305830]